MSSELLKPLFLRFYLDSGHGYLQVPKGIISQHKLKISCYSYKDKGNVYLEEDSDAPRFIAELEKFYRIVINKFDISESDLPSIRSLRRVKFGNIYSYK